MSKKRTQSDYTTEMMKRADEFKPVYVSSDSSFSNRQAISEVLPEGSTLGPPISRTANSGLFGGFGQSQHGMGGGGSSLYHTQRPYLPDIESPDRQQYPEDRVMANYYWRLFHKYDPIFGNAIDMYSDMLFGDYDIEIKEDDSHEIRDTIELMCEKCSFLERMKQINKEFLVIGEAFPHNFFDDDLNIWTYTAIHNPDYIDVKDSYMINTDPIILFVPDEGTRDLLNDNTPESLEFRRKLPTEFVSKVMARQKIKLSSVSCSHIARKLHHYDNRGTSMASRMWRIFMVEDAVYKSTIATYRRHAAPLKVIKLGDPSTHWMPAPGTEGKIMEMVTRAEMDPNCFVPETKVTLSDGTMTNIDSLEIGDNLIDKDGNICQVEVLQEEESNNIIELEILGSENIKCTPNHKWPIWGAPRHYKHKDSRAPSRVKKLIDEKDWNPYQKVTADQLCVSDYLMIPRYYKEKDPGDVCEDKARLLGYYAAEGNIKNIYERQDGSTRTGFVLSFNINEIERFVDDSCKIIEKLCGFEPWLWKDYDGNVCQVNALRNDSNNLALWLAEHAGTAAKTKRLSQQVMSWPLHLKREFTKGYLAGGGLSIGKNDNPKPKYIEVGSASKDLTDQVRLILAQLGGYASFSDEKQDELYKLRLHGELIINLSNEIFGYEIKDGINNNHNECWVDENFVYVKITGIKRHINEEPQKVINMTVSGDHSYCVHHFGTRNSWICWNYGIQFEAWGTTDRAISIKGEHDVIEKIKLMALGLSKSFMSGEVSYACQFGDAKILMDNGSYKDINTVEKGEKVVDIYGNEKHVTDVLKYDSPDEMIKITTYGGRKFYFTDNHELPVFTRPHKCLCGCGEDLGDEKISSNGYRVWKSFSAQHHKLDGKSGRGRKWIEYKNNERIVAKFPEEHVPHQRLQSKDIRIGDWLTIPRKFEISDTDTSVKNLARARLLGYYVAEGSISECKNTINNNEFARFSFGKVDSEKETQYVGDVKEILNVLGCEPSITTNHNNNTCYTIYIPADSRDITLWLKENGHMLSNHKKLSSDAMHWNLELKKEIIKGMYRGDGHLHVKDEKYENKNRTKLVVRYTTTSKNLTMQLELILAQLGYACMVTEVDERIDKNGSTHSKLWFVDVNGKQAYSLAEMIWGSVPSVWDKHDFSNFYKEQHHGENTQVIIDDNYIYLPVTNVEVIKTDKEEHPHVYSLTVDDSHSYTTSNISSYNSVKGGLQVFLRRLLSLRQFYENTYISPRFFRPISIINEWEKPKPSEIAHNYRIKRTAQQMEEENRYIIPKVKWKNNLDSNVDQDLLMAYQAVERMGIKISKDTISSTAGLDWEHEFQGHLEDFKKEQEIKEKVLGKTKSKQYDESQEQKAAPGGKAPGGKPPAPGGKPPAPGGKSDSSPPGSAPTPSDKGPLSESPESPNGELDIE